jgi:anti-sigma regulatory factor (Ser/Thr protein kinase)
VGESIHLEADSSEVARARHFCVNLLGAWGSTAIVVDTVELLVSEAVTNAILHARTACVPSIERLEAGPDVRGHSSERVRVEVSDRDPTLPMTKHYDLEAGSGRGLHLIEALSDGYGAESAPEGKLIWFEVTRDSAAIEHRDSFAAMDGTRPPHHWNGAP